MNINSNAALFLIAARDAEKEWKALQDECVAPCSECGLTRDESAFIAGAKWALGGLRIKEKGEDEKVGAQGEEEKEEGGSTVP